MRGAVDFDPTDEDLAFLGENPGAGGDDITEDAITAMLGVGFEFHTLKLVHAKLLQEGRNVPPSELAGRLREITRDPELKKKSEQIILRAIAGLACGRKVNRFIRLSVFLWCAQKSPGRAGNPGLGAIESIYRRGIARQIIKENSGAREKTIVTKIMRDTGLNERSAKALKKKAKLQLKKIAKLQLLLRIGNRRANRRLVQSIT